jgi:hypothetical protein
MSDDNGPKTIIALWVMTTVSFLFMNLRFFCKGVYTKKLRLDDGVLLVAWVCAALYPQRMPEDLLLIHLIDS